MPRGAKPKVYDAVIVQRVAELYASGMTQAEVAAAIGITQKVVWRLMLRSGIAARVAAKRDQRGHRNAMWRGGSAGYQAMHLRVAEARGTPSKCEHCGTTDAKRFEWANLSGRYDDVNDYVRLCVSCHHKMDGHARNLGIYARIHSESYGARWARWKSGNGPHPGATRAKKGGSPRC